MGQISGLTVSAAASFESPESKARDILSAHWDMTLPVDVKGVAESIGLDVEEENINWSGIAKYDEDNNGIVIVNKEDPEYRRRFTIAHEIGHFVLGHVEEGGHELRDQTKNYSLTFYNPKEVAANKFAAELLMPAFVVRKVFMSITSDDIIHDMAEKFAVSDKAMKIRLKMVGLLPNWA